MRLRRIEDSLGGAVVLAWHTFLLRPHPDPHRTLERFKAYTKSWQRPAADPDGGTFREWATEEGPPSHSVPPHLVAKAAAQFGHDAFHRMHDRLLHAYFAENRDITDADTLMALWREVGLAEAEFGRVGAPEILSEVVEQHNAAVRLGVTGVPAVAVVGTDLFVVGAQSEDVYRRWIARVQELRAEGS